MTARLPAEAGSPGRTRFTLLGAASDYFYFGHRERFNTLYFDLHTLGDYGARTWEYSKGNGFWGTLILTSDGTNGFSQDGAVVFSPPSDWKQDTVNAIVEKFWIRVSVVSVTTAATVNQIKANLVYNCLMLSPKFNRAVENPYRIAYELTFAQQENP